jgi:hypothetical protein
VRISRSGLSCSLLNKVYVTCGAGSAFGNHGRLTR